MTTERAQPIDPYEVLGFARDANVDEIHAAYRRLARRVHPDVATKDASEMAQINEAWRILRRSAQHGHVATKETSATTRRVPTSNAVTRGPPPSGGGSWQSQS